MRKLGTLSSKANVESAKSWLVIDMLPQMIHLVNEVESSQGEPRKQLCIRFGGEKQPTLEDLFDFNAN